MLILVDDDEMFRSALAANLRDDGYDVLEYGSARAVPLDQLTAVDALLLDLDDGDALDLAERFHQAMPRLPIVIMSAFAPARLEKEVAARPHLTLLRKPLDYEDLRALLESSGASPA
jgi:DNA-binding NtrC family response regulator